MHACIPKPGPPTVSLVDAGKLHPLPDGVQVAAVHAAVHGGKLHVVWADLGQRVGGTRPAQAQRLKSALCRESQRAPWYASCLVGQHLELHLCCSALLCEGVECCAASRQAFCVLVVAQQWSGKMQKQLCHQGSLVGGCDQVAISVAGH